MIGVFDSGVGGLSVLSEIRRELRDADLLYFADQARAPYGVRSLDEVAAMSMQVTEWLLDRGATTIAVACNTASAAALHLLREAHPEVPFVGMEPAVKPAASLTATGIIGVVATAATFQGRLFASLVERHAHGVEVISQACPDWVEIVESGRIDGPEVENAVQACLQRILDAGADTLVLGCTHFTFLSSVIRRVTGSTLNILDPAPAIAKQVGKVAPDPGGLGSTTLYTSGDPLRLQGFATDVAGISTTNPALAWSWHER
jgi:glutamate racemase